MTSLSVGDEATNRQKDSMVRWSGLPTYHIKRRMQYVRQGKHKRCSDVSGGRENDIAGCGDEAEVQRTFKNDQGAFFIVHHG